MQIRSATADDAEGIAAVQERGWQVAYRHVYPVEELDRGGFIFAQRWRARLERPPRGWATFVAELRDDIVGFVSVGPSRDEHGLGELYALYVEPAQWSAGIGRALIERAEEQLATAYDDVRLWVLEQNTRARAFYEAHGWEPDGERKAEERWGVWAPEVRYAKRLSRQPGS